MAKKNAPYLETPWLAIRGEKTPDGVLEITTAMKFCYEAGLDCEIGRELRRDKVDFLEKVKGSLRR